MSVLCFYICAIGSTRSWAEPKRYLLSTLICRSTRAGVYGATSAVQIALFRVRNDSREKAVIVQSPYTVRTCRFKLISLLKQSNEVKVPDPSAPSHYSVIITRHSLIEDRSKSHAYLGKTLKTNSSSTSSPSTNPLTTQHHNPKTKANSCPVP